MQNTHYILAGFFFIISGVSMFLGVLVHTGVFKGWWLINSNPVTPVGIFYALIPTSIFFLVFGVLIILPIAPEERGDVALYVLTPLLFLVLVFAMWQPKWLKPKWLQWLEVNHENLLTLLWEDAQKRGGSEWQRRLKTQEGLEEWVAEVRSKYKLDEGDPRFIGDPHA